jgi:hypothetical protein
MSSRSGRGWSLAEEREIAAAETRADAWDRERERIRRGVDRYVLPEVFERDQWRGVRRCRVIGERYPCR